MEEIHKKTSNGIGHNSNIIKDKSPTAEAIEDQLFKVGEYINNITSKLFRIAEQFNDFNIYIKGTGSFSKNLNNEILWLGIRQKKKELDQINYELKNMLESFIDSSKISNFFPHLTIARKKKKYFKNKIDVKNFMNSVYFPMEFHVKYFTLFQSILTNKGIQYVKIKKFPLK